MTHSPEVENELDVSRETLEKLQIYAALLKKWNPAINLVSKSTISTMWQRHIEDSLQIYRLIPNPKGHWVDLGSGGGFPGLIVAICATERTEELNVTLVESDQRKCAFLRSVLRETGTRATVLAGRVEAIGPLAADILSARALAELPTLLTFAQRHMNPEGCALFPKGATWKKELAKAQSTWSFDAISHMSKTDPASVVLQIREISNV